MNNPFVDLVFKTAARVRRNRVVRPEKLLGPDVKTVKVNVGSGLVVTDGWINIDANGAEYLRKLPRPALRWLYHRVDSKRWFTEDEYVETLKSQVVLHHDVTHQMPFPDDSVDVVFSSHFLEHLYREDAERFLREAYRVLKPGGLIRTCVPDLERVMNQFRAGDKERALKAFFMPKTSSFFARHKYMYDFDIARKVHEGAGFTDVARRAYQEGEMPDVEKLDNKPEETLYVEARKPAAGAKDAASQTI